MFVETIVSEMDVFLLFEIAVLSKMVFLGGKSGQTIFIDVNSQGVDGCQSNIYAKIKFVAVNKKRVVDILTDYHLCTTRNLLDILGDENTLALRT